MKRAFLKKKGETDIKLVLFRNFNGVGEREVFIHSVAACLYFRNRSVTNNQFLFDFFTFLFGAICRSHFLSQM